MKIKLIQAFLKADIETSFQENYFENTVKQMRLALLLAVGLVASFSTLDIWVVPDVRGRVWSIRFGIMIPTLLIVWGISFTSLFKKFWYLLLSLAGLIIGFSIASMVIDSGDNGSFLYPAGLSLVIVWNYVFSGLLMVSATVTSILVLISYLVVALGINSTPSYLVLNHNYFIISTLLLVGLAAYLREMKFRTSFMNEYVKDLLKVKKSIQLTQDSYYTGMTVINGFVKVLTDKFSSKDISVSIEQEGLKVTLLIVPPNYDYEQVERLLEDYALVLMEKRPVGSLFKNSTNTRILEMELKQAKAFYELQLKQNEEAIKQLQHDKQEQNKTILKMLEEITNQLKTKTNRQPLSAREMEVLKLLQETGSTNYSIAHALNIAENTVETHIRNIKRKLGVEDRDILKKIDLKSFSQ